jgi:hypothetical protein
VSEPTPSPQLDPDFRRIEEGIRGLHQRLMELRTAYGRGLPDSDPAADLAELSRRVEELWSGFVSIERIRDEKLRQLSAQLDAAARRPPTHAAPRVPPIEGPVGAARSRRGVRFLRWPRLALLLALNVLTNVYVIIWEQRHDSKIFPGT